MLKFHVTSMYPFQSAVPTVELKDKGFVVKITDTDLYFKSMLDTIKELGLTFTKEWYERGDYMVVGLEGQKDIFRTESKPLGNYTVYELATSRSKIEKALREYAAANKPVEETEIHIGSVETTDAIYDYVIARTSKPAVKSNPVKNAFIGETFVKVGLTLCPIFTTCCGIKYITYGDNVYQVCNRFCGKKTLELIS